MHKFYKTVRQKMLLCKSEDELIDKYIFCADKIQQNEIIIQEYISGGNKRLYSFASFSINGAIYTSFIVHRIRQRPRIFGSSTTFAKTVLNDPVQELSSKFIKEIGYTGLSEVEFMFDERNKKYKFLEINPRFWKWHSIANKLGINFIKNLLDYFEGHKLIRNANRRLNIGWIDPISDFFIFTGDIINGTADYEGYLKSLKMEKEIAAFSKDDVLPGLMYIAFLPYLWWSRS
jgi:predicted ATP-grasp superfamily ATP-dependent carboligase